MARFGPAEARALDRDGFVVLPGLVPPDRLACLRERIDALYREEGEAAGAEFRVEPGSPRLANLAAKGKVFREAMLEPTVLEAVRAVLGPRIKLSSLNARRSVPGTSERQPLHVDHGAVPDARGPWVCNTIWMLDAFTSDNGPVRAVPGSHRSGQRPADALADCLADHRDQVLVTGPAGSVAVMNAHTWHGGIENRAATVRTALHVFYCREDRPQQQYQRPLMDEATLAGLTAAERDLLALDDPRNDALCLAEPGCSGFLGRSS